MRALSDGVKPDSEKEGSELSAGPGEALAARKNTQSFITDKRDEYQKMIWRVRRLVGELLPHQSTVLVTSKGDGELLKLEGRRAWHFPCSEQGEYDGYYPGDSFEAITQLERHRAKGADHILFPATSLWWLEFYADFRRHLEKHYTLVASEEETCLIYDLRNRGEKPCSTMLESGLRLERHTNLSKPPGNQRATEPGALELAPDDYELNFELARLAWERGQMETVEERLTKLVELYPSDVTALVELVWFYCARLGNREAALDESLVRRFLTLLADTDKLRRLPADVRLSVAESLGEMGEVEQAMASLDAALQGLSFEAEELQGFVLRLLRTIVSGKSVIPFDDGSSLAAFLTQIGNGFAATHDRFKAEACYRLAIAADSSDWNSATWAARFNLAFAEMARGNAARAMNHLRAARRLSPDKTATIIWPAQDGLAWPRARFNLRASFEELKPEGSLWPKITVITPSFNQGEYIEETLLSVLNQSYPALEYIVVDAESSDGTKDVLKRYEARLAKLIIEPDEGQTDAINKGLRLATGDLILWLNSDDLLGPGALFRIALEYLKDKADIIYGFCCEHRERRFGVINLPAITPATFNVECLGDIFNYWLKGHYFYQPEVAFSRRILERVGGSLSMELAFTMDYEFWLRCARAEASLSAVHWPVGFFRKHDRQKTANLDRAIIEQARVRDRFLLPEPSDERKLEIKRGLKRALSKPDPEVSIASTRASEIFSPNTERDLRERGIRAKFHSEIESLRPGEGNLIIVLMHLGAEHQALRRLREAGHEGLLVGWFWENHHRVFENYRAAADVDICIPGYEFAESYLRSPQYLMLPAALPCVTEWAYKEASILFEQHALLERCDELGSGFVQGMSSEESFKERASHKASLCLPASGDISRTVLNALLAGQIPIVPPETPQLDELIPREAQGELPVVRCQDKTTAAIAEAHAQALRLFDSGAEAGLINRHQFALKHTFSERVRAIIAALGRLADGCKT